MCAQSYYNELASENYFKKKHFKMLTSFDSDEFANSQYIDENEFLADHLNDYFSIPVSVPALSNGNGTDLVYDSPDTASNHSSPSTAQNAKTLKNVNLKTVKLFQKSYFNEPICGELIKVPQWRLKEKTKTASAALVICLNIGVDPPDVDKNNQSSKMECWINPQSNNPQKALELIGAELQKQYERWQPRARYRHCLDPTSEDVNRLCLQLRKSAKEDRVLFHYNGHGVPKPTSNGEIWVFNREFTQYIPLSLYEVQTWMGTPSLYVWDTSNAGMIIQKFLQFEADRENELLSQSQSTSSGGTIPSNKLRDSIHLAACGLNENLPSHPSLPADLFTSCLTTPIKTALHWYVSQKNLSELVPGFKVEMLDRIPGQVSDRKTMMGELNWIFTAITDTIAWNLLDTELFQKLFRQDLLVASLFRNYLLAERIMKSLECTPVSSPALPPTNEHPLWQSWDLALDMCIHQLPKVLDDSKPREFVSCGFFAEQIEIFDVWLKYNVNSRVPPEQLPVVLQVLLSQQHRQKALELLGKFLDFGAWAVSAALSVGIFPYVLKLVTTHPRELRPLLTFIWTKILAVDRSCQAELVKDNGHVYFINVLADADVDSTLKVYSAFVLSCIVDGYAAGQESARQNHLISNCTLHLTDRNALLRQWCAICLGLCWKNYPEARWQGVRNNSQKQLMDLIGDPVPEVRAAAVFALGTTIECPKGNEASEEQKQKLDSEIVTALLKDYDSVYFVRKEIIIALYYFMCEFEANVCALASASAAEGVVVETEHHQMDTVTASMRNTRISSSSQSYPSSLGSINDSAPFIHSSTSFNSISESTFNSTSSFSSDKTVVTSNTVINRVWRTVVDMQRDPYPDVAELAQRVVNLFVNHALHVNQMRKKQLESILPHSGVSSLSTHVKIAGRGLQTPLHNLMHHRNANAIDSDEESHMAAQRSHISTEYIAWASKYFLRPLQAGNKKERKDFYTAECLEQHCKLIYNYKLRRRRAAVWREPHTMDETLTIKHSTLPLHCKFHPYSDDFIFVADQDSVVKVYDSKSQTRVKFSNVTSNRVASKITSFKLVNAQYEPIVLTGSDDACVRLFKPDLITGKKTALLTAFNAFSKNEKANSSIEAGLVLEWDDVSNNLLCAGDTRTIRIWDMNKELHRDVATDIPSCVCSLTSNETYAIAGFGDGTVKLFDLRLRSPGIINQTAVKYEHNAFVLKVFLHRDSNKLVTASTYGDVNITDIRNFKNSFKLPTNPEPATAIECHPVNELIAIANSNQTIKIYDFKSKELATIKHHEGFLGKRIASVSCMDWNLHKNELVFGSQDFYLSVFTYRDAQLNSSSNC